jgi:hypothetical protein
VCFIICKTTSELEHTILTTLYFADAEITDGWRVRKGNLQRAFPLDVPMVHSSTLVVSADSERLTCGGFSLSEIVPHGSLEFIADCFCDLSLSPMRNNSGAAFMGATNNGSLSLLWAMIEDSTEEFYTALS